jgi:hypothetical protein
MIPKKHPVTAQFQEGKPQAHITHSLELSFSDVTSV